MSGTEVGNMKCGGGCGLNMRSGSLAVVRIALGALFLLAGGLVYFLALEEERLEGGDGDEE